MAKLEISLIIYIQDLFLYQKNNYIKSYIEKSNKIDFYRDLKQDFWLKKSNKYISLTFLRFFSLL